MFFGIFALLMVLAMWFIWFAELIFYQRHNWDFTVDNSFAIPFRVNHAIVSNRERVLIYSPFTNLIFSLAGPFAIYASVKYYHLRAKLLRMFGRIDQ
jgi:hypothetical protein